MLSSYRRLARLAHPDCSPADPSAAERFAALNAARTDLLAYCRSRGQADGAVGGPTVMVMIDRNGDTGVPEEGRRC